MHTVLHINLAYQKEQQGGGKKNPILLVLILTTQPLSPNWHALCCCQFYSGLAAHTQNLSAQFMHTHASNITIYFEAGCINAQVIFKWLRGTHFLRS